VIDRYYFDKTPKGRPDLRGVYVKYLEDFGAGSKALAGTTWTASEAVR
jgi:hypothetical protein